MFLISAPTSASGKTTISRSLMAALTRRGKVVQPFKCGPDFIDTKFHEAVCHRPSINLDPFMATPQHIRQLFYHYSDGADISIVEGMMGLFDGYSRDKGSTADIAAILNLPVILVVNAQSAAYSLAALLSGFVNFRSDITIAGVIFNKVGSPRHFSMLQEICQDLSLTCFGYLPKDPSVEQASRYLGLDFSQTVSDEALSHLIELAERYIDIPKLSTLNSSPITFHSSLFTLHSSLHSVVLQNDESFSFIYAEHLDILRRAGTITFIDPESDQPIPDDTDFLYLPGGYPEKHAKQLSQASRTINSIRDYINRGGKALAECGGMIYLSQGINFDDEFIPMAGVLPFSISFRKQDRKLSLGYRQFTLDGKTIRGHEFHYSQIDSSLSTAHSSLSTLPVVNAKGEPVQTKVFRYKNLLASYIHLFLQSPDLILKL